MIKKQYAQLMAKYNTWQNGELIKAVGNLDKILLNKDLGIFFGSIQATCNHILWADNLWFSRIMQKPELYANLPKKSDNIYQNSRLICEDFAQYAKNRAAMDAMIEEWANTTNDEFLSSILHYKTTEGTDKQNYAAIAICQVFNHQTHHRGQIHGALGQVGVKPYETDLPALPNNPFTINN